MKNDEPHVFIVMKNFKNEVLSPPEQEYLSSSLYYAKKYIEAYINKFKDKNKFSRGYKQLDKNSWLLESSTSIEFYIHKIYLDNTYYWEK